MPRPLATSRTGIEPCPFLFPDVAFRYGLIQRTCWLAGAPGLWVSCSWDHRSHGHVCFLCALDQLKGRHQACQQPAGRPGEASPMGEAAHSFHSSADLGRGSTWTSLVPPGTAPQPNSRSCARVFLLSPSPVWALLPTLYMGSKDGRSGWGVVPETDRNLPPNPQPLLPRPRSPHSSQLRRVTHEQGHDSHRANPPLQAQRLRDHRAEGMVTSHRPWVSRQAPQPPPWLGSGLPPQNTCPGDGLPCLPMVPAWRIHVTKAAPKPLMCQGLGYLPWTQR